MPITSITTKVISTLGNPNSLLPVFVKDGFDSGCITYQSYKAGGKVEGLDRAMDEFGTQAVWLGGIPLFKKIFDMTAYKIAKINPNVDTRIIANKEYADWALKNAHGVMTDNSMQTVKSAISDSVKNVSKSKGLYIAKVATATALTLGSYFLLTKTRHNQTEKNVKNEIKQQTSFQGSANLFTSKVPNVFKGINENISSQSPSFKGNALAEAIMFNPVHNMKILDVGITTERLASSRNKVELVEHSIKEGAYLFFLYKFGNMVQNGINKFSEKVLKKPIDLDIDVLMSDKFESSLSSGKIIDDLTKVPDKKSKLTDILDFIVQNPDNIVVHSAKKSGIVSTLKNSDVVDTSKFIDRKSFETLTDNLLNISDNYKQSGETVKKYLSKTKILKVSSVMSNLVLSCAVLGYAIPKGVYLYRKFKTGSSEFHVANDIKEKSKSITK